MRWLALIPSDFIIDGEWTIHKLLNLITINFNPNHIDSNSEAVLTLFTILGFLGNSSISTCDSINRTTQSVMTCRLMERMPLKLRDHLKNSLNEIIKNLGINKLQIIISSMFEWPQNDCIHQWILALLVTIEKNGFFNLLSDLCITSANRIAVQLQEGNKRNNLHGAIVLLQYLLYGFRRSPQGFHNVIASLIAGIKVLDAQQNEKLYEVIEMCYILIFRWPGYPNEYYEICALLHQPKYKKMEPNDQRIRYILQKYEWKANRKNIGGKDKEYKSSAAKATNNYGYSSNISLVPAKRCKITDKAGDVCMHFCV